MDWCPNVMWFLSLLCQGNQLTDPVSSKSCNKKKGKDSFRSWMFMGLPLEGPSQRLKPDQGCLMEDQQFAMHTILPPPHATGVISGKGKGWYSLAPVASWLVSPSKCMGAIAQKYNIQPCSGFELTTLRLWALTTEPCIFTGIGMELIYGANSRLVSMLSNLLSKEFFFSGCWWLREIKLFSFESIRY